MSVDGTTTTRDRLAGLASEIKKVNRPSLLAEGKRLHADVVSAGLEESTFLGNLLVQMYGKCGSLNDAEAAFNRMTSRNVYSWTLLMAAYLKNGEGELAIRVTRLMDVDGGCRSDSFFFATALAACAASEDLLEGRALHIRLVSAGFGSDVVLQNSLVNLYSKCGSLAEAEKVFDKMSERDLVSWNSMLSAHVENGDPGGALNLYWYMNHAGEQVDEVTFLALLRACADTGDLRSGRDIHARLMQTLRQPGKNTRNGLLNMYAKCESFEEAEKVFEGMDSCDRDLVTWTCLIDGYSQAGRDKEALHVYTSMILEGLKPDFVTFIATLAACNRVKDVLLLAEALSETRLELGVGTALINAYSACGCLREAKETFESMQVRSLISWNSMVAAYAQNGVHAEAVSLFRVLNLEGLRPSLVTFINVLAACVNPTTVREVVDQLENSRLTPTISLGNSLLSAYAGSGMVEDAENLFERMASKDVVSWTLILRANSEHGYKDKTFDVLRKMDLEGIKANDLAFMHAVAAARSLEEGIRLHQRVADSIVLDSQSLQLGNVLMNMYSSFKRLDRARDVLEEICTGRSSTSAIPWTNMLTQYSQHGCSALALELYWKMNLQGVRGDEYTYLSLLVACSNLRLLDEGRGIHATILDGGFEMKTEIWSALVNMYAECGSLSYAENLFLDYMATTKDVVTWTSIIGAKAHHGQGKQALELFHEMNLAGIYPNEVTFTCILHACGHLGLLHRAREYFTLMVQEYQVEAVTEHYRCMVDLLARSGKLEEAEQLASRQFFEGGSVSVTHTSLLNACRLHGDVERGARAARVCLDDDNREASSYVLLSQVHELAYTRLRFTACRPRPP